jgi:hypothetical protein
MLGPVTSISPSAAVNSSARSSSTTHAAGAQSETMWPISRAR